MSHLTSDNPSLGILDPQGPIGRAQLTMLLDATAVMSAIVVPVILLTLAFAWWFRASNRHAIRKPEWEYSGSLEMVIWCIPALVIMFLGGMAWVSSHELDPSREIASDVRPLDIEVVSLDWKWLFIYPGQNVASVSSLVVPVGTPLRFRLTSTGVMNSFFVPQLGSQVYTMAGMETQLNLLAETEGTFAGLSAQFSGDGFSDMRFDVKVLPSAGFDQWAAGVRAAGGATLDVTAFDALKVPSRADPPKTFSSVQPALFEQVMAGTRSITR